MRTLSPSERASVESFLFGWREKEGLPSLAVAVTDRDRHFATGFGVRSLVTEDPVSSKTLFCLGSCTKAVTAAAVLRLTETDHVSLSDPIEQYLSLCADIPGDPITIRDLLTHTSGVPSDEISVPLLVEPLLEQADPSDFDETDFEEFLGESLANRLPDCQSFMYYNTGYVLLGRLIEKISGDSYNDYVRANIFEPLEMHRSGFSRSHVKAAFDRMQSYVKIEGEVVEREFPFSELIYPSGGLFTSVADFLRFAQIMSDNVDRGTTVLSDESRQQMTSPHARFGRHFDGTPIDYGYGVMVEEFLGKTLIHHGGQIGISSAWFGIVPTDGLVVVLTCATEPTTSTSSIGKGVIALLEGERPEETVRQLALASRYSLMVGQYESRRGRVTATVEKHGQNLRLSLGEQQLVLSPERVGNETVFLTIDDSGYRQKARFVQRNRRVELLFERHRLFKQQ